VTRRWTAEELRRYAKRGAAAQAVANVMSATYQAVDVRMANYATQRHRGKMNRLESAYAQHIELERLAGVWQWWVYEGIKLRLASGAYYTPDFALIDAGGHLVIHETKGHWREAAKVRIKVAAELYPFFRFVAVTRQRKKQGGNWLHIQY
jgi:hypothetical protein